MSDLQKAIFASGCFWGTEYHLQKASGVLATRVGYTGGTVDNPSYEEVCANTTGHAEAVEVTFDPTQTDFETLARLFFETHDPTQLNRQGPDVGFQYRSEIFYLNEDQQRTAQRLIEILRSKGLDVVTHVTPAAPFWEAEDYHQNYYDRKGSLPYCHVFRPLF